MQMSIRIVRSAAAVLVALALAACGGGGGGGAPAPLVCGPGSASFSTYADASVTVGKAAGATVAGCTGALSNVRWTQVGGPPVALLSDRTQTISFEPPAAGTYAFRADFIDAGGAARSATVSVNAAATASAAGVVLRVDQSVRKGGKVSLRAWPALAAGETQTWTQIDGPAVALDTTDPNRALFTA
ncbi:MAG: hypothetical protein AB1761_03915, partial [Pseudomonadota bacterium]